MTAAELQVLLEQAKKTNAAPALIESLTAAVARARAVQTDRNVEAQAELEQIRLDQLTGSKKHAKELEVIAMGHDAAMRDLQQQRLATDNAAKIAEINAKRAALEEQKKINKQRIEVNNSVVGFLEGKGLVTDFKSSKVGKFLSDMPGAFDSIATNVGAAIQPMNLFAAGAQQMFTATSKLFTAFDQSQAELSKLTATTGEYNDMLYDIQEQNKSFNVGTKEAGEAIGQLHQEMKAFSTMSAENQQMLATTSAQLSGIGLEARAAAQQMDNMVMVLGMSAKATNDASLELVSLGTELGFSADMISDEFNASMKELSAYGPDAIDVFKGMAAAAKATGIEVEGLIGIVDGMDTFKGAAEAAGQLNAVLGGGVLDTNALLMADHDEKIRMIKESVAASGQSWDAMNRFEKKVVANAAGISDLTQANKLFGASSESMDKFGKAASGASAEAANLEERAKAATSFSDKLERLGEAFAVAFMPILDFAHGAANMILELSDATGGFLIPVLVGLVGVLALASQATAINNVVTAIGTGLQAARIVMSSGLAAAQTFLASSTVAEGTAAAVAAPANVGFAASLATVSAAALPLVPAILGLGMAIGGIGLAIAAPFIALAAIVWALKDLFVVLMQAPEAAGAAAIGLIQFAGAAALAMVILAGGMIAAGWALASAAPMLALAAGALTLFGEAMLVASLPMLIVAAAFWILGKAMQEFENVSLGALGIAALAIAGFIIAMSYLAAPAFVVSWTVGVALMSIGLGLLLFGKGLQEFNNVSGEAMIKAAIGLLGFVGLMMIVAAPMATVGALVGLPLIAFGAGLILFGKGLQEFNDIGWEAMVKAAASLVMFSAMMILVGPLITVALGVVGLPLMLMGAALWVFAQALLLFNDVGPAAVGIALLAIGALALGLLLLTIPLNSAAYMVGGALVLIGGALYVMALALGSFQEVGTVALSDLAMALMVIAVAAIPAGIGLGIISYALVAFAFALAFIPLEKLWAFNNFGRSIEMINQNKDGMVELNNLFTTISSMGDQALGVMDALGWSIWKIAIALSAIPESKAIAFSMAMVGYKDALTAVANLAPEQVEMSAKVVAQAAQYQETQAKMRLPDEDSFVQALTRAFGGDKSGSGSGKGQDIVMKVNGREFARAVDAAINKKHNISLD